MLLVALALLMAHPSQSTTIGRGFSRGITVLKADDDLLTTSTEATALDGDDVWPHAHHGIGGVSAGATSRLLLDYSPPVRALLLDIMFKPNFVLSLSHLKVESPGSDADSTCGAEPSWMHSADDLPGNAMRGYEGFLLREARARSPNITLSILQWGAPSWVNPTGNKSGLYTEADVDYVVGFVKAIKQQADTTIDFVSAGHNERPFSSWYIKRMRQALDTAGLENVKVLAADTVGPSDGLINAMSADPQLRNATYAITTHVTGRLQGTGEFSRVAQDLGLPLIASEEHIGLPDPSDIPMWDWSAAKQWAVTLNRNFIDNREVASWLWSLIFSWYSGVAYDGKGFFTANRPWSGSFSLPPFVQVTMQHTQFYSLGWRYLNASSTLAYPGVKNQSTCFQGRRAKVCSASVASFVALVSPDGNDFSVVIETMLIPMSVPTGALRFALKGRLSERWANKELVCRRTTSTNTFEHAPSIRVASTGEFSVPVMGSAVISVSSRGGQVDGTKELPPSPPPTPFPLPYADDFQGYANDSVPRYLSDFEGAFAVVVDDASVEATNRNSSNGILRQFVRAKPLVRQQR